MDGQLLDYIRKTTPPLNYEITNGIATSHMRDSERYVDEMIRTVAKNFPPGVEYRGCVPCSPEEEFAYMSKRQQRRGRRKVGVQQSMREYDIARSDTYLMKYIFAYKGEELKTYLSLPFVSDGGIIYLSGTRYVISPVLADQAFSYSLNSIFVIFGRAKVKIERMTTRFYKDGVLEHVYQPYALIHNKEREKHIKPRITAHSTLFHYLLCKYGFAETFSRFTKSDVRAISAREYTEEAYPSDKWVVCTSATSQKPKTYGYVDYTPTDVCVLVPRSDFENPKKTALLSSMIGSFFYLADHFPQRIQPEHVDKIRLWRVLLGLVLWGEYIGEGELFDDITTHIESLDEYVDERLRVKLRNVGVHINDIYDFFAVIIENLSDWIISARDNINSLYNKDLSVLYYTFYKLQMMINNFYFGLKASAAKKELTPADVSSHMMRTIRTGFIYSLLKDSGVISTVSSPNSNKALKLTVMMVPQSGSTRAHNSDKRGKDPTKRLHASNAEVGGAFTITKTEPSAYARVNPHVRTDRRGAVQRDPQFVDLLDSCQEMIKQTSFQPIAE